jgi:hypothetical protein
MIDTADAKKSLAHIELHYNISEIVLEPLYTLIREVERNERS